VFVPSSNPEGNPLNDVPDGYEFVRVGRGGIYVRRISAGRTDNGGGNRGSGAGTGTGSFYEAVLNESALRSRISGPAQTVNGVTVGTLGEASEEESTRILENAQSASVFGPLNLGDAVDPNGQFVFDRAAPLTDVATGERTGLAQTRGVYGSADSLERQLTPGSDTNSGTNENIMTVSAGVLWLRNLAARDKAAYNKLVVMLRNAGYLTGDDEALPLNGYSQQAGVAFALAANDLAHAYQGGDTRTLMEYLTERGQGYADFLAQEEADAAAADAYVPVERQYTDPATLRASAKAAAVEALGRKLTDEEEARFEAAFRAQEDTFYNQLDTARENETRFAAYAPDVTGQVSDFIDGDEFETERAANKIGELSQVFMQMMGLG
jgi:hypothetical protein